MSLDEIIRKVEKLQPDQQERILTLTATKWIGQFTQTISKVRDPMPLVEKEQTNLTFCIIQLTKPEHREAMMNLFKALANANPLT